MGHVTLFPTYIWHEQLLKSSAGTRLSRELRRDALVIPTLDPEGQRWSKRNYYAGYTSYGSIITLHRRFAPFMDLEQHLDRHVLRYAKRLGWDLTGRKLKMTSCWLNIMPKGCSHSLHLHPLSVVSGTYYLQTPPGSGSIKFEDPRLGLFMGAPTRKPTAPKSEQAFFSLTPKAGDVVLFESWLRHEVGVSRSRTPRISVSFNYQWL